jgi:hypothetical protein
VCTITGLHATHPDPAPSSLWRDERVFPAYVAAASVLLLVLRVIASFAPIKRLFRKRQAKDDELPPASEPQLGAGVGSALRAHVAAHGGLTIYAYKLARFVTVLALLVLYVVNFVREEEAAGASTVDALLKKKHKHRKQEELTRREWVDLILSLTYVRNLCIRPAPRADRPAYKVLRILLGPAHCRRARNACAPCREAPRGSASRQHGRVRAPRHLAALDLHPLPCRPVGRAVAVGQGRALGICLHSCPACHAQAVYPARSEGASFRTERGLAC